MPREKSIRAPTVNIRKAQHWDTQKQYRHTYGLNCREVMMLHAFQAEMVSSVICSQRIRNEVMELSANLRIDGTPNEHDALMEEVEILQVLATTTLFLTKPP